MYERMLIATDGSDFSDAALKEGFELAHKLGSEVTVVYVVDALLQGSARDDLSQFGQEALDKAKTYASEVGIDIKTEVLSGKVGNTIVDTSEDYDVVVLADRGRGKLRKLLLGSVSQTVLQQARCSVILAKQKA